MNELRVTCLQLEPRGTGGGSSYVDDVCEQIRAVAGADLIVLPELWHVGYFGFDDYQAHATGFDGPLPQRLAALARELNTTLHVGSLIEAGSPRHNTSLVFGPGGSELARYRKMHVFGYQSREPEFIAGGERPSVFPLRGVEVGMAICYDLRFPELFRSIVDRVAVYVIPATWPKARIQHWSTLLRARAIENQAFVIGCNAAGWNHQVELGGKSAVIDPWGEVVVEAGTKPSRLDAIIDLDLTAAVRAEFPVLRDRVWFPRISAPSDLNGLGCAEK